MIRSRGLAFNTRPLVLCFFYMQYNKFKKVTLLAFAGKIGENNTLLQQVISELFFRLDSDIL